MQKLRRESEKEREREREEQADRPEVERTSNSHRATLTQVMRIYKVQFNSFKSKVLIQTRHRYGNSPVHKNVLITYVCTCITWFFSRMFSMP